LHPILFRVGATPIYTYTVLMHLGLVLGLLVAMRAGQRRGIRAELVVDAALWMAVPALVGGRIGHILPEWANYAANPRLALSITRGGFAFQGVLLGGALGGAIYARRSGISLAALSDLAALGLPVGQACGWLGALMHGANYGVVSYAGWAWELPDVYGVVMPRFPTQAVATVGFLGIGALLLALWRRKPAPGLLFPVYLLAMGLLLAPLECTRGDPGWRWGAWRAAQALLALEAGFGLVLLVVARYHAKDG